jgi:glucose/arabinose dehydrogenase
MKSKFFILILFCLAIGFAAFFSIYVLGQRPLAGLGFGTSSGTVINSREAINASFNGTPVPLQLTEVTRDLVIPWSIVFTDHDRMLVTERRGTVRLILNGQLQAEPFHTFKGVSQSGEEGLMGMILDPAYTENKYIYFAYAYTTGEGLADRVVRMTDTGTGLVDEVILLESIPAARNHAGARLRFGPDGKLYVTTGDASDRQQAQDLSSLAGKILRINSDGSIPEDNPFPDSPVFSYGHRNPQGLDWHPTSQLLYSTEHGPSGNDGPGGGDEINIVKAGGNYGWPVVSHTRSQEGMISPVQVYTPALAPASGMFYRSSLIPQFSNHFLFGGLRGQGLFVVYVNQNEPDQVTGYEKIEEVSVGRVREVVEGPDGAIYLTTSNRDGRGRANEGDDKIYRLAPVGK